MSCEEFWKRMPELEDSAEHEHPRGCAACAARWQRQMELRQGLGNLAQNLRSQEAPGQLETKLLQAFREHHQVAAARGSRRIPFTWGLAAAALIACVFLLTLQRHSGNRLPNPRESVGALLQTDEAEEFWPLPNASGQVSAEDSDLITVEVPTSTLVEMGVPVADDGPARVQAVLALDADGVVQGIRLLQ